MGAEPQEIDARVRRLVAEGHVEAASEVALRELGPDILRYIRSTIRDEALAADAFSEFAEDFWTGLPGFRGEASLKTWAFRIAWNAMLRVKNDAWQRRRVALSRGPASALANEMRTHTPVALDRQARVLDSLRSRLSMEEQGLLALRVDQGLSWAEVAEVVASEGEPVMVHALVKRFQRLKDRISEMARAEGLVE